MKRRRLLWGALFIVGCSGRAIDVGPAGTGATGTGATGTGGGNDASSTGGTGNTGAGGSGGISAACTLPPPAPVWVDSSTCVSSSNLPIVGTWSGYQENAAAPWDSLTLEVDGASVNGGVCGKLTVGAPTTLAPATRADEVYPPGSDLEGAGAAPGIYPGYALTLIGGKTDGTRVQFTVADLEYYRSWCQLQSSYEVNGTTCNCIPSPIVKGPPMDNGPCSVQDTVGDFHTINCEQAFACNSQVCACSSAGCDANAQAQTSFDLRFDADSAEGSATSLQNAPVHFTRVK